MATVKRRTDRSGRWQATVRIDGKERTATFGTKGEGERWVAQQVADASRGVFVDPAAKRRTFGDYAKCWQVAQVQHRPATAEHVDGHLRNHILPAFAARPIGTIRRSDVQAWASALSGHLAPSTVKVVHGTLATIFRAAVNDGVLPASPCGKINLPEIELRHVEPLQPSAVDAVRSAIEPRYSGLVALAAGTGMRQGECFGLTTEHVDFLRREIRVAQQLSLVRGGPVLAPLKTRASYRTLPAPTFVLEALAAHIAAYPPGTDGLVFTTTQGRPIRRNRFGEVWRAAVKASGLPAGTGFHTLRHTYASLLIESGASVVVVQARLGHKTAKETLDTYGHLWHDSADTTRAALDRAFADQTRTALASG